MINWNNLTADDHKQIQRIARRAPAIFPGGIDHMSLTMDLGAAHLACPMRLAELADADDFNFAHDVGGIMRHLDRNTGELTDCFTPRYAA